MEQIGKTLTKQVNELAVNSNNSKEVTESTVNSSNTVNSAFKKELDELIERHGVEPKGMAMELARLLLDNESVPYYELLIREHGAAKLFPLAYQTKEKGEMNKINTKRAIYFQGILKRLGLKHKFKKEE